MCFGVKSASALYFALATLFFEFLSDGHWQWLRIVTNRCRYTVFSNMILLTSVVDPDPCVLWASWIRIRHYFVRIRILPTKSRKGKKNLDFYCFVTFFFTFINENWLNVPSKSNKQKTFLLASCHPLPKKAGSGCERNRTADPDPYQNVKDPQYWLIIQYYRETWPGSSLSSRRAPRQTCRGRGANLRPPAPQADALPKELSRQFISWLFGTSTWPEAGAAFGPLQYPNINVLCIYK
jgi:hypothetical protein